MSTNPQIIQTLQNQVAQLTASTNDTPLYQLSPIDGDIRVTPVGNPQLLGTQVNSNGSLNVAIGFTCPTDPTIDHYEVWVQRTAFQGENPALVSSITNSPALFTVNSSQATVAISTIVTVLKNGLRTDFSSSPTVTFNIPAPSLSVAASAITAGTLPANVVAQTVTLNSNGITTTINNIFQGSGNYAGLQITDNSAGSSAAIDLMVNPTGHNSSIQIFDNSGNLAALNPGSLTLLGGGGANNLTLSGGALQTSASAGSNGAVPSQVAGYLELSLHGTTYKVPLFNL